MKRLRNIGVVFVLVAGGAGCSLLLDLESWVPCATAENCAADYRCLFELCAPDDGEVICGDRVVEGEEPCDDGNLEEDDLCTSECELFQYPGACTIEVDQGLDAVAESRLTFTYDERNYRTVQEWDGDLDGVIDARTYVTFDDYGRKIREERDANGDTDGSTDTVAYIAYTYGLNDRLASVEQKDDITSDVVFSAVYDWTGATLSVGYWDLDGDGTADATVTSEYDADENPLEVTWDRDLDGVVDDHRIWTYDTNGFLVRWERDSNGDNDGNSDPDVIELITNDTRGNVTRLDTDSDADGTADQRDTYRYDCWPDLS